MTLHPAFSSHFYFSKPAKTLYMLVIPLLLVFFFSTQSAIANEETTTQLSTEFSVLNESNLSNYVAAVSQQYYRQAELLHHNFQFYQQKRDPRGFNVWHLKGFSPEYQAFNTALQDVATNNQKFLAGRSAEALTTIFAELRGVSINLLIALRESNLTAYHEAKAVIKEHEAQLATILREHQLEENIRDVSLD